MLRGHVGAAAAVTSASWIGMPVVVVGELVNGFIRGSRQAENEARLVAFLGDTHVDVQVVDEAAARIYAEIIEDLRALRLPIPTNDVWIAAVAARDGATVVTLDPHFERIARIGKRILPRES